MIYIDTSAVLAHPLAEDRYPPDAIWKETLVSSRRLEFEVLNRLHLEVGHDVLIASARSLLARIGFVEMNHVTLARALDPFPIRVRTLDAIHLASVDFLLRQGQKVSLATYDQRMIDCARLLGFTLLEMER